MNATPMPPGRVAASLTVAQIRALTLWKWRYALQTLGFTRAESERLLFTAWRTRRMVGNS